MRRFIRIILNNVFGLVGLSLFVRITLRALSANAYAPVVSFIYRWTDWLLAPVNYIFPNLSVGGGTIDIVALSGIALYALFFFIVIKFLRLLFVID